jgi:hypothetical protein
LFSACVGGVAIRSNDSRFVGILVGVFKVLCSVIGIFVLMVAVNKVVKNRQGVDGLKDIATGAAMGGSLGWIVKKLINGERVLAVRAQQQASRPARAKPPRPTGAQERAAETLLTEQADIVKAAKNANATDSDSAVAALIYAAVGKAGASRDLAIRGAKTYVQAKLRGNTKLNAMRAAEIAGGVPFPASWTNRQ